MNLLVVGTNKATILEHLPDTFLLIDDGELIDDLTLPKRKTILHFDFKKDSFDPVQNISYQQAREFISILTAVFPEGDNTLTKASGLKHILKALKDEPKSLGRLIEEPTRKSSNGQVWAYDKIDELLLSPVLNHVLNRRTNFSFTARREGKRDAPATILARLNRAELGDFDCFVLANLLISQYKGTVVIPDFGFYAHEGHNALIRQQRLIAGVNWLDEVPAPMRNRLLLIEDRIASHCLPKDAEILAQLAGYGPNITGHSEEIAKYIK